ncbi:MAG: SpoIIE family protein phosphatase [Bacteroidota bacterium]
MHFKFTIGKKIGAGFGVLLFFTIIVFLLTYFTLKDSRKINEEITDIYNPSVDVLEDLNRLVDNSKLLITKWVLVQSSDDDPDKDRLRELINADYPAIKKAIEKLAVNWSKNEEKHIEEIFQKIESLFILHEDIMSQMNTWKSYEEALVVFFLKPMVEGGEVEIQTEDIQKKLANIIELQYSKTNKRSKDMKASFDDLEFVVKFLGIGLLVGGILIALFTVRTIVKPVQQLKTLLLLLGRGIIPKKKMKDRDDEIGEMSAALNDLVSGFKQTTRFANEVGSGNFQSDYQPLSSDDTLGHSLLAMRKDLFELTSNLEHKVKERTEEVVRQKEEIEVKNNEITASIRYARRIQEAILPDKSVVNKALRDYFILYKPKDIVSGDFYWIEQKGEKTLFAAVDCTGHGVPGAFMSLIGNSLLNQAVDEHGKTEPSAILNELNKLASETISQTFEESVVKDGMDIAFCSIDFARNELQYSGAFNPLYLVRKKNGEHLSDISPELLKNDTTEVKLSGFGFDLIEIKADKFPIGVFIGEEVKKFTNHKINLEKGDTIYVFSDGYVDQFGGVKGRKYMATRFRQLLLEIQHLSMEKQREHLDKTIEQWRMHPYRPGVEYEQIDDILVIGVRV